LGNETAIKESFTVSGNIVHWSSSKCKRITRSILASEIYAMAHDVNIAVAIGTTVTKIADRLSVANVPVIVCTDFYSFYECLIKLEITKKKRLMINIIAMRQIYEH
jgi:hypothetical protein